MPLSCTQLGFLSNSSKELKDGFIIIKVQKLGKLKEPLANELIKFGIENNWLKIVAENKGVYIVSRNSKLTT